MRIWNPWLAPRHGKSSFDLDKDAVLCSFLSPQGKHLVLLGISGLNDTMTLFRSGGSDQGNIYVSPFVGRIGSVCFIKHSRA